jgi:GntP family gluconate:H+ symporter
VTTLAAAIPTPPGGNAQLIAAAVLGIAAVVALISWLKVHPFLALILGSATLGLVAGLGATKTIASFTKGVGDTVGSVGLLIALGAMIGGLLADSGGGDRIVDTVVQRVSDRQLPWAMAGVAALIGLPLFFEVGVVLLVPVVLLVSRRSDVPLLKIGIPALAGLSVLHGLVPPHPGPLVAIAALKADLGLTLAFGLVVAIPTVVIAGPVFGSFISRYVTAVAPAELIPSREREPALVGAGAGEPDARSGAATAAGTALAAGTATGAGTALGARAAGGGSAGVDDEQRRPAFGPTVATVLLPIVLMLLRAGGEVLLDTKSNVRAILDVIGNPVVALLAGVLVAMFTLGMAVGMDRRRISDSVGGSLPAIAGILLIVAAGGGFKQVLVDAGVGQMVGNAAKGASLSPLILGWLVAVGIRVATGSATVATITAAGIVAPLAASLNRPHVALLALAVGAGSLFFSHVNDAGFWLVKQYFGLTVGQTIKSWSVMETIISVVGLACVLLLSLVV